MTASRSIERENGLHISVYSHTNMKLKMKASSIKPKSLIEIRKMLEREYSYLTKGI